MIEACPSCGVEIEAGFLFCPSCVKQVRCRSCRSLLMRNANGCVVCGVRLGDDVGVSSIESPTSPQNYIEFEETKTRRFMKAQVTDQAIESVAAPFGMFMANRF